MKECNRCTTILTYLDKTYGHTKEDWEQSHKRILGNIEQIYIYSRCNKNGLVCLPLQELQERKVPEELK
jgi:hypothetical protein